MNKFLKLIDKAKIAILSSEFLEKNAEALFKEIDKLENMPWTIENEKQKNITLNKIKNIIGKSEVEYKNLLAIESEVNAHIKKKSKQNPLPE